MLLFLDESYEPDEAGGFRHVYAGCALSEKSYRGVTAAMYQCRQEWIVQDRGLSETERIELARTRMVQQEPPERAEIKASKILNARQVRRYTEHGASPGIEIASRQIKALEQSEARVFGVLSYPNSVEEVQNVTTHLPVQFIRVFERVEQWMQEQHPEEMVVLVPDNIHAGINRNLSERIADFLFRSEQGKRMRHLVVNPFWVDSQTTAGSQQADLIAHLLLMAMRPTAPEPIVAQLWNRVTALEFRSLDGETRGIRKLRRRRSTEGSQQAGADAH